MFKTISVEKATLYEQYRLPYAHEAVDGLLAHIGEVRVVADIGAGTGQLARLFAGRCAKFYAVEPDPAMRQVAADSLAGFPGIEVLAGFAEQTTLPDASIDLIVMGNAFHRFKPEAGGELHRILKPSGWIALFTYAFTNPTFTDRHSSRLSTLKGVASRMERSWHRTPVQNLFGAGHIHTQGYRQSHAEDWTAFFGAACAGLEAPEPDDQEFGTFEALQREVFDTFAVNGIIQIEYETRVSFGQPQF